MEVSLRGIVLSHFDSVSDFARSVQWDRKRAADIVNGRRRPTAQEMETIATATHMTDSKVFLSLFFPSLSTM